ncbi:SRPBCC family protein [Microlunatus speluncae]|uniref:SRPBCC family protein n=1 Tax=Microlunatus speluncae TaxID=2594267 RepID=UPI0012666507|nr:SRPBCC family protein [Microlunatus speluncae]
MNAPTPTGRLIPTGDGHDLELTRVLPGTVDDAWASITEPERTARWIGHWEGTGAIGETIKLRLGFEDETPWTDVKITECDAPRRLRVLTFDQAGTWDLSLELAAAGDTAELRFVMHRIDPAMVGEVGPGWEYYLDQLLASMTGGVNPDFNDYFPAQRAYFEGLVPVSG